MAKGNLFLGTASGIIGDVVFWRQGGTQRSRVRVRRVTQPETDEQVASWCSLATADRLAVKMRDVLAQCWDYPSNYTSVYVDFTRLLMRQLNEQIRNGFAAGNLHLVGNFASKLPMRYTILQPSQMIAKGSLTEPISSVTNDNDDALVRLPFRMRRGVTPGTITYKQLASYLGLKVGDAITFLCCTGIPEELNFDAYEWRQLILMPSGGDETVPFMSNGAINEPNVNNTLPANSINIVQDTGSTDAYFLVWNFSDTTGITRDYLSAWSVITMRQLTKSRKNSTSYLRTLQAGIPYPLDEAIASYRSEPLNTPALIG